jgi:hypothetical protein
MLRVQYNFCIKPSLRKCEQDAYYKLSKARTPAKFAECQYDSAKLWFDEVAYFRCQVCLCQ